MKASMIGLVLGIMLTVTGAEDTISHALPLRSKGYGHPPPYAPSAKPYGPYTPTPYSPNSGPRYHVPHRPKKYHPLPNGYHPSPKPNYHGPKPTYHSTPKPVYHSTPKPVLHSTPTPTYHPTPTPVYHSKPTPIYHSTPKPVYTPTPVYHPKPKYQPKKPVYHEHIEPSPKPYIPVKPVHISHEEDEYNEIPHNYAFGYAVKDGYSGDDFSHSETRDGHKTEGEYRVALPDGRTQIVSYYADENGYHADVKYEGEAIPHPEGPQHSEPYVAPKAHHEPTPATYVSRPTTTYSPSPYHPTPSPTYAPSPLPYKVPVTPIYPSPTPYKPRHPTPIYKEPPAVYKPKPDPYHARSGLASLRGL
ncbi:uncharacterized protein LOC131883279 [Tigriopus californicus]|uniref:uncharacterized protein LOC131883279 n=1 Tax=Tigriopus californicus TaxID=6832 RepID=UPI0027DA973B|nr:uncharacterized protein LOC131883279 [Tigriopus californicus]